MELVVDAVKFTPNGGIGRRSGSNRPTGTSTSSVADTGFGIAPEFLPHIFERFRQGDSRFAREFGGLGPASPSPGTSSRCTAGRFRRRAKGRARAPCSRVRLPATHAVKVVPSSGRPRSQQLTDRSVIASKASACSSWTTMPTPLSMVRELLETAGANVTTALSADEALVLIERQPPDLLSSDIGMPSVDGFELIRRVRQLPPAIRHVPAAALTAYAQPEDRIARPAQRLPGSPREADRSGRTAHRRRNARRAKLTVESLKPYRLTSYRCGCFALSL